MLRFRHETPKRRCRRSASPKMRRAMNAELELRHLRVFLAVVESGAQARAARTLGISQSTATETISALERVLGAPLFHKQSRRSTLTPAGEALVPYAKRALALTNEILGEV